MNPIVVVAGTRPEHLKVAEVIRELRGCGRKVRYVWTGQHTSPSLAADVFAATDGPYPDVVLPWPAVKARSGRSPRVGADKPPQLVWAAALWSASAIEPHLADAALVLEAISGHDPMDSTSIRQGPLELIRQLDMGVAGLRVGRITDLPEGSV